MKDYIELGNRISWQDNKLVTKLLLLNKNLDILHDNGSYFIRAVESNSADIVKSLLDYFEKNQLSAYKEGCHEYHILKNKMHDILEMAIEDVELSLEMKQVLSSYLDFEGDLDSRLQEFNEEENSDYQLWASSLQSNSDNPENIICSGETEPSPDLN